VLVKNLVGKTARVSANRRAARLPKRNAIRAGRIPSFLNASRQRATSAIAFIIFIRAARSFLENDKQEKELHQCDTAISIATISARSCVTFVVIPRTVREYLPLLRNETPRWIRVAFKVSLVSRLRICHFRALPRHGAVTSRRLWAATAPRDLEIFVTHFDNKRHTLDIVTRRCVTRAASRQLQTSNRDHPSIAYRIRREPPFLPLKGEGSESGKGRARRSALIGKDAVSRYKGKDGNNFPLLPADVMRDAWESAGEIGDRAS